MTEPNAVALFSTFEWPTGAVGRRPLLAFEPYESGVLSLEEDGSGEVADNLIKRGFEQLADGMWTFPKLDGHMLAIFDDLDEISLIDEAWPLFEYPLSAVPSEWYQHVMRERVCLVMTGRELHLATEGIEGVQRAARRSDAFGGEQGPLLLREKPGLSGEHLQVSVSPAPAAAAG